MKQELTISIDAMGGDHAPAAILDGLAHTRIRHPKVRFLLHGDEGRLASLLDARPTLKDACTIRHTAETVGMDEKPSQALRRGRSTSMWRAIESVQAGEAKAAVSAGNTGALMAMALFQLRTMEGIPRPAIAALWPTTRGQSVVLDVGANVNCTAEELVDFAIMGEAYARAVLGLQRPTVGLLNIGTEEVKGNEAVKAAAQILREASLPIEFAGFVEGDDISAGTVDVVVTDGFTGNVALKTAEGTAKMVGAWLKAAMSRTLFAKLGYLLARGAFDFLKVKMDPRSVNGGVFLGLNGIVVKSHGGTDGLGFATAVDLAIDTAAADLPAKIAGDLAALSAPRPRAADAAAS